MDLASFGHHTPVSADRSSSDVLRMRQAPTAWALASSQAQTPDVRWTDSLLPCPHLAAPSSPPASYRRPGPLYLLESNLSPRASPQAFPPSLWISWAPPLSSRPDRKSTRLN